MNGLKRLACVSMSILLPGILIFFVSGCGIYEIDTALMAPYNLSNTTDTLTFYGDDEPLLDGYNLWYKEESDTFYLRCYYYDVLETPTIDKELGEAVQYTVDLHNLYPQVDDRSFYDINFEDDKKFYFAVSAYGTGIAESGKVAFPRWPY